MTDRLPLRIILRDPVPGVALRLQSGRSDLVAPTSATPSTVVFDFEVRVVLPAGDGPVRFLGPVTQGPADKRFVYINSGSYAGEASSCWSRRAKVPLTVISAEQVREAFQAPGSVLEVSIAGRGKDGGPVCASVKLRSEDWLVRRN